MTILIGNGRQGLATLRNRDGGSGNRLVARLDKTTLGRSELPCREYQEKEHQGIESKQG